jgi:hypothetical protein
VRTVNKQKKSSDQNHTVISSTRLAHLKHDLVFHISHKINRKPLGSIVKCYNRHDGAKLQLFFFKRITKLEGKIFSVVGNFFSTSSLVTQIKELMVSVTNNKSTHLLTNV